MEFVAGCGRESRRSRRLWVFRYRGPRSFCIGLDRTIVVVDFLRRLEKFRVRQETLSQPCPSWVVAAFSKTPFALSALTSPRLKLRTPSISSLSTDRNRLLSLFLESEPHARSTLTSLPSTFLLALNPHTPSIKQQPQTPWLPPPQ